MTAAETIGVVAIGRNEGRRLLACLQSARRDCVAVVYVDSGSSDGSIDMAKSLGVEVVQLDTTAGFSAARARNAGFERLLKVHPNLEFVQFVDGDCEIVSGWIERSAKELQARPQAAVVCGRRRERHPTASRYNRLCDLEWDTPIGQARSCGGDALMRIAAFQAAGGYNPIVIAGEEPELCVRLRQAGWTVWRIDAEMTLHDAAMMSFGQWWKRMVRSGHAYAQGFDMHGHGPEYHWAREVRSIQTWTLVPTVSAAAITIVTLFVSPRWSWLAVLPLLLYPLLATKVALSQMARGRCFGDALLYGLAVALGKFAQLVGLRKYQSAKRSGRASSIIEYKTAPV